MNGSLETEADGDRVRVRAEAYAKWNPMLCVGARRSDGFHELVSVLETVDLTDTLEISLRDAWVTAIRVDAPGLAGGDTLVTRALEELLQAMEAQVDVTVRITKRIPAGGGMAGGSADAVAAVRAVCTVLDVDPDPAAITDLLARVGSDLPALWSDTKAALVGGRGELVEPIGGLPARSLALLWPGVACPTAEVFARHLPVAGPLPPSHELLAMARAGELRNDLEPAARSFAPRIGRALDALRAEGLAAALCGSGAAIAVVVDPGTDGAALARGAGCTLIGDGLVRTRANDRRVVT